jgi:hypothetical protein
MNILLHSCDPAYATGRIVAAVIAGLLAWRMLMRWAGVAPLAINKTT